MLALESRTARTDRRQRAAGRAVHSTHSHLPLRIVGTLAAVGLTLLAASAAPAQDPENCLSCHRFRGLSRVDPETNELRLFFCSAEYYAYRQGQHARVRCTGCHKKEEVAVIPHHVKTPVDCTQTCHIAPATGTELRFSHKQVHQSLEASAHSSANLARIEFDPPLLRPGQSTCLYCHDQPTFGFGLGVPAGFRTHGGGTRCDTCHTQELPLEITYFANHVAARMKPARPVRQLAQVCAVCHSDPDVMAQTEKHDTVASYLHSFHGKAALLGSTATATCVDCHSSPTGDQHLMLAKDSPLSSINPVELPDTCRTTMCHPGAPPQMSAAAVHLNLDPARRTPEFYVAAFFILMTAGVMALFFVFILLELLNALVRRHDVAHLRLVRLARRIQQHPQGRALLVRTSMHQRWQHWLLVVSFALLVITGMPIKFAEHEWAHRVVELLRGLTWARLLHRVCGVVLIAVFLYHVGYLFVQFVRRRMALQRAGNREPLLRTILNSPMMLTPRDLREFAQLFAHLLFLRRERPHFGRYNFMQKFEYWAVFWGVPVMGLSGIALWEMPRITEFVSGRVMNFAFIIHSDEAYLAFIYVAAVHIFSVVLAPVVFPLSPGTITGQAPAAELAEGHRGELERVAAELGIRTDDLDEQPASPRERWAATSADITRRAYSAVMLGVYGFIAFASLRFLILMLVTHQSAPIDIVEIPKRLDADTYLARFPSDVAQGPQRPRGPLAHFHQIPQWFQPAPRNNCTTVGCHTPLPHGQHIEVRAFLNMHATFVECTVCHLEQRAAAENAQWLAPDSEQPVGTPAILRLAGRLEVLPDPVPAGQRAAVTAELLEDLRAALPASGRSEQLERWVLRLETTHPQSRTWTRIVQDMRENIHMHVHGEYAARIGLFSGGKHVGAPSVDQQAATEAFLRGAAQGALEGQARQQLLDRVHAGISPSGALCTPCHLPDATLIDMRALGYPPARVQSLQNSAIVRQILSIEAGQPFSLPLEQE